MTVAAVVGAFALSVYGFQFTDKSFFPASTTPKFRLDVFWPVDQDIDVTERRVDVIEKGLAELEGVTHVASSIGQGPLRFILTFTPEKEHSGFAQFLGRHRGLQDARRRHQTGGGLRSKRGAGCDLVRPNLRLGAEQARQDRSPARGARRQRASRPRAADARDHGSRRRRQRRARALVRAREGHSPEALRRAGGCPGHHDPQCRPGNSIDL